MEKLSQDVPQGASLEPGCPAGISWDKKKEMTVIESRKFSGTCLMGKGEILCGMHALPDFQRMPKGLGRPSGISIQAEAYLQEYTLWHGT